MDTNKSFSLFIDGIDSFVSSFVSREGGLSLSIGKPDKSKTIYRISRGNETGVITFYLKKNGLVSISIQGSSSLNELCNRCCDSVIQQSSIPNSLRKSFTIRNSNKENIGLFKIELNDTHNLQISPKVVRDNTSVEDSFDVYSSESVRVCCTIYTNGTFLLQGNVTPLYITVLTESIRWLLDSNRVNNVTEVISLNNLTQTFTEEINVLVPNLKNCGDTDGIIERMILTSVALFNSGVIVEDYGCYTFGVLKALEGVLKLRLSEDLGPIESLGELYYFDYHSHRHRLETTFYDGDLDLKKALNKGYNTWVSARHSSFHADDQISTSTLLSYEQAHEVFVEAIECINGICDNWG